MEIYLMAAQVQLERVCFLEQAEAVEDISLLVLPHLETMVVLAEMAAVVVEPQTIQEQAALAVLAYFIYTTKKRK
jgi:hypothetical protein